MSAEQETVDGRPRRAGSLAGSAAWLMLGKTLGFAFTVALPLALVRILSQHDFALYKQAFLVVNSAVWMLPLGFGMSAYYFLPRAELVPLVSAVLLMRLVRTLPHTIRAGRDLALFEVLELYLAIIALVLVVTLRRRLLGGRPASTPGRE